MLWYDGEALLCDWHRWPAAVYDMISLRLLLDAEGPLQSTSVEFFADVAVLRLGAARRTARLAYLLHCRCHQGPLSTALQFVGGIPSEVPVGGGSNPWPSHL